MTNSTRASKRSKAQRWFVTILASSVFPLLAHCGDSDGGSAAEGGDDAGGESGDGGSMFAQGGAAGSMSARGGASGGVGGLTSRDGGSLGQAGNAGNAGSAPMGGASSSGAGGESAGSTNSTEGGSAGADGGGGTLAAGAPGSAGGGAGGAGGADAGGAGTASTPRPDFILGADISSVQEAVDLGATFVDTDGRQKPMAELLAAHGFNFVRLRTFVDPMKLYGYANPNGDPAYTRAEAYCDRDHTAEFGKQLKDAGMKLLLDLHYSDNWADPGKQVIPERWRDITSIEALGESVESYTREVIQHLVGSGARPDIVQLGNEITPGMLIHVPAENPNADQWGNMNKVVNPINGSTANWTNLGTLLRKSVEAVHAVDPTISIMLHLENTENTGGVIDWITAIRNQGVEFDILGLSCYPAWQGSPAVWQTTFQTVTRYFPDLRFVIAEYGPEARRANEIMRALPDARGLGTFLWEPTQSGPWGPSLFTRQGNTYTAMGGAFAVYDAIRADFGVQ
jgi:arabinogalactan endo-1,4-beta-galactosidase